MRSYIRRSPLALLPVVSFAVFIVFALSERFATAYTVGADLRVCPGPGSHATPGADLRICPGSGSHTTTGADTQVWPYDDSPIALGREAATSMGPAEIARQQAVPCVFDNFVW